MNIRDKSSSEVVRAGLSLLEEQEIRLAALRERIECGLEELDRGEGVAFDAERINAQRRTRLAANER